MSLSSPFYRWENGGPQGAWPAPGHVAERRQRWDLNPEAARSKVLALHTTPRRGSSLAVWPCWSSVLLVRPRISKRLYCGTFQKPAELFAEQNTPSALRAAGGRHLRLLTSGRFPFLFAFAHHYLELFIYLFSCGSCAPSSNGSPTEEELRSFPIPTSLTHRCSINPLE